MQVLFVGIEGEPLEQHRIRRLLQIEIDGRFDGQAPATDAVDIVGWATEDRDGALLQGLAEKIELVTREVGQLPHHLGAHVFRLAAELDVLEHPKGS